MREATAPDDAWGVVLAGGRGTRFWPLSRRDRPKQCLSLDGGPTLLARAIARAGVPPARVLVVTGPDMEASVRGIAEPLGASVIVEPSPRGTAPAIAWAAQQVARRGGRRMVVLPADHVVRDEGAFAEALTRAWVATETGDLVVFGIRATRPETGFGWIVEASSASGSVPGSESWGGGHAAAVGPGGAQGGERGERAFAGRRGRAGRGQRPTPPPEVAIQWRPRGGLPVRNASPEPPTAAGPAVGARPVARFVEKPPPARAAELLAAGASWNAGIFAWRVDAIEQALARFLPRTAAALAAGASVPEAWDATDAVSIDVGVLERATNVVVVPVDCGWSDVGAWSALDEALAPTEGGTVHAKAVVAEDAARNIVHAPGKVVALLGVDDLVVVDTPDVLLVTRRGRAQDVRDLVERVERRGLRRHT